MAQAIPSSASLPSDYALVARYAAARGEVPVHAHDQVEPATIDISSSPTAPRTHTNSSVRPVPVMAASQATVTGMKNYGQEWRIEERPEEGTNSPLPTENTPLIAPYSSDDKPEESEWWRELKILSTYTAPVFACVSHFTERI